MFSRAIDWKMYEGENPVKKLPNPGRKDVHFLTPAQIQHYLSCCSKRYYPIAATLVFTGVRKGELLQIRWDDIDFKRNMIKIRADSSLKNANSREIPINSQLLPILKSLKQNSKSEWVFVGPDGKSRMTTFDKSHRTTREKAGMPNLTIHNFRHTFASLALQSGSDVGAVSKLLGHSSIRVTMEIYHHLNPDHARNVIENLPIKLTGIKVEEGSEPD
jgi:integrase